jgi:uncharacterized protein YceK
MKILKITLAIMALLLYGCATVEDYNPQHDLPYGDPDWEHRIMLYRLGF